MGRVDIKHELQEAIRDLASLLDDKQHLEVQIAKQRRKVAAWEALIETDDEESPVGIAPENLFAEQGLSDACRTVIQGQSGWMTLYEIRLGLQAIGFDLTKYKAVEASIATTVNRLVDAGEVIADREAYPGAVAYRWSIRNYAEEWAKQLAEFAKSESGKGGGLVGITDYMAKLDDADSPKGAKKK